MGMTITEKILAKASNNERVHSGCIVQADIDYIMITDVMAPLVIQAIDNMNGMDSLKKGKIILVQDHFIPAPSIRAAEQTKIAREFYKRVNLPNYIEAGRGGICHVVVPDMGFVAPGEVVVGSDSHTTTYGALGAFSTGLGSTDIAVAAIKGSLWFKVPPSIKVVLKGQLPEFVTGKDIILYLLRTISVSGARYKALEISGETIKDLSIEERFTICNMAVEAGAKNAIIEPDEKTIDYLQGKCKRSYEVIKSDKDAEYEEVIEINCEKIKPQIAYPHSPDNVYDIDEAKGIKIDQVYIGSCTNGRFKDLMMVAEVIRGKKIHPNIRLIVTPGSQKIYLDCLKEGIVETIVDAGGIFNTPSCGACFGGHMGVLASGEVCLSTTNRNFKGRMGSGESEVYLASPIIAAATALTGEITDPREVI